MDKRVIDILSSYAQPKNTCAIGNETIARGAIEAGVNGVFSYPGTPSTEISEIFNFISKFQSRPANKENYPLLVANKIYFEYSINEKVALEKAIAFSIGNKAALCVMKNVGMNVASDALMSITYQTIIGPLVIILCDDPGCHSSSNEQDSRYWGKMAGVPLFNPATPAEAHKMCQEAFRLSEELKLPVIVRMTTRVSHTRGNVLYGKISKQVREAGFDRIPEHINIPARTATAHQKLIAKLHSDVLLEYFTENNNATVNGRPAGLGIICSGVASSYVNEIIHTNDLENEVDILTIGLIWPFPSQQVLDFLKQGFKKILVLEELEPIIENDTRALAQKNNIDVSILGKGFSTITSTGEFSISMVATALAEFSAFEIRQASPSILPHLDELMNDLPPRPPALCSGCPHRATFYALKLAMPRDNKELILCGDIGCFGLGALPPLRMIDTINHMGMSISMAQGLAEAFRQSNKEQKLIAMMGDGTFFHSGIPSLLNAIYTRANILLIIFDNRTIGMTGHQEHPGASSSEQHLQIDIASMVKGMGVAMVDTITPFDLKDSYSKLELAMEHHGVAVIVSRAPCIFLPDFVEGMPDDFRIEVDPMKCNTCANHEDTDIGCSRCGSSLGNISRAKAKLSASYSVPGESQLCPANICNHGFFQSILESDFKSAIEIVRDKMLFSRTCGSICHRPCELFTRELSKEAIPIKSLKKYVSGIESNFLDFSGPISRAKNAEKKNKKIAIVGAGPAGASAAYDLLQNGYDVEIFEKEDKAGGLIQAVIPNFRMDKKGYDHEIAQLEKMGAKMHFNKALGKDVQLSGLSKDYDAVLLAFGLGKSKSLDLLNKNISKDRCIDALTFLRLFNSSKLDKSKAGSYLVIGGGNSAIDAARSAKRLHPDNKVIISCIESKDTMPAFDEEIAHGIAEGVTVRNETYVHAVCQDSEGISVDLHDWDTKQYRIALNVDYVIIAIGQQGDIGLLDDLEVEVDKDQNRIIADNGSNYTNSGNVFVAGDLHAGNNMSIIGAIAGGKKAAVGIRHLLEDYSYPYEGQKALDMLNSKTLFRNPEPMSGGEVLLSEIQQFDLYQSCQKCNHCIENFGCPALIKVNGKVEVDQAKCTKCGLCVDVCPNDAIHWVTSKKPETIAL